MVGNAKKLRCSEWFLEQGQSIDHFVGAHATPSSVGCDRLNLPVLPGGDSIRLGSEVISAENALAYVAELSEITGAMSTRGVVVLHAADPDKLVDRVLVQTLGTIMDIEVIIAGATPGANVVDSVSESPSVTSNAVLTSRDHHSSVFDPRRPMHAPGPAMAKSGMVIKHSYELGSVTGDQGIGDRSVVVDLGQRLRANEAMLGHDAEPFWVPVLVNLADQASDAIPLSVMRGDHAGTIGLAAALGFDLAVIEDETGAELHLHLTADLDRQLGTGAWRLLVYTKVIRDIVPIVMKAPEVTAATRFRRVGRSDFSIAPRARRSDRDRSISRLSRRLAASRTRQRPDATRIDQPHPSRPMIERPHRSQASRPANYLQVLRARHLNRERYRTDAAPLE